MNTYNLKFEKTKSGNFVNDLFLISFDSINGLNVVRVEPTFYLDTKHTQYPLYLTSFYFKDLTSALKFCSRFHVPHDFDFWNKRQHHLLSYDFWFHFSSSLSSRQKEWLNSLNHE